MGYPAVKFCIFFAKFARFLLICGRFSPWVLFSGTYSRRAPTTSTKLVDSRASERIFNSNSILTVSLWWFEMVNKNCFSLSSFCVLQFEVFIIGIRCGAHRQHSKQLHGWFSRAPWSWTIPWRLLVTDRMFSRRRFSHLEVNLNL